MKSTVPDLSSQEQSASLVIPPTEVSQKEFKTIVDELLSMDTPPTYPEELEFMREILTSEKAKESIEDLLRDAARVFIRRVTAKIKAENNNKKPAKIVNIEGQSNIQIPFQEGMQEISSSYLGDSHMSNAIRALYYKQLRDFSLIVRCIPLDKDGERLGTKVNPTQLLLELSGKKEVSTAEIKHIESILKSRN